jgi:phosphoglycerate dehydrogenase-like enzyme
LEQARFESLCRSATALYGIPDSDPATLARVVATNDRLAWVHTMAAGGAAQVRAATLSPDTLSQIRFTTSAGVHAEALAEFGLLGVLAGAKDLSRLQRQQRERSWSTRWSMRGLADLTVLVLGLGHIGRATARKLHGLGARVVGVNRTPRETDGVDEVRSIDELLDVVGDVDAIINTLPESAQTFQLLNDAIWDRVRPGVIFVSTGRGTCVDEDSLVHALGDGRVGFAAMDVFEVEPLPDSSPLWEMDNVLVSPHTAALTDAEDELIVRLFAQNAGRLLDGRPMLNEVERSEFATHR